jgi:hypothetical protein
MVGRDFTVEEGEESGWWLVRSRDGDQVGQRRWFEDEDDAISAGIDWVYEQ